MTRASRPGAYRGGSFPNAPEGRLAFLRYALTGAAATAVHYAVLIFLSSVAGVPPWIAAAAGAGCGALLGYGGNRSLTFRSRRAHSSALPRFLLVAALGAASSAIVVWAGTALLGWHYLAAQLGATVGTLAAGFRLNRAWTFA